jgi:hypothetical protein
VDLRQFAHRKKLKRKEREKLRRYKEHIRKRSEVQIKKIDSILAKPDEEE